MVKFISQNNNNRDLKKNNNVCFNDFVTELSDLNNFLRNQT